MQLRTNKKTDPNRNQALSDGETMLECVNGAISVMADWSVVRVKTVRGILSRKAQFANLTIEEVDELIRLLHEAKTQLINKRLSMS